MLSFKRSKSDPAFQRQATARTSNSKNKMASTASIDRIHRALLVERDRIRAQGLTFAQLIASPPPGANLLPHIFQLQQNHRNKMYWDHIEVEAREIARGTSTTTNKGKREYTPEEKAAYKARKTSQALAYCQKERERVIRRQAAYSAQTGFTF